MPDVAMMDCAFVFSPAASSAPATGDTLRIAFGASMTTPDPAIFYENEGLNVIQALYEGLLQYAPNTPDAPTTSTVKINPLLATDYTISSDGLKYTFHLRDGVKFHDGTTMDSAAVKASFDRFTKRTTVPISPTLGPRSPAISDLNSQFSHQPELNP